MALENKLGITISLELAETEERISKKKAIELFENGELDTLKAGAFASLKAIHKYLFDEIVEKYVEMNIAYRFREGNSRSTASGSTAFSKKRSVWWSIGARWIRRIICLL